MIRILTAVIVLSLILGSLAWAGPLKAREVAAEAKWMAHMDIEKIVSSQIGKFFLGVLEEKGDMEKIDAFGTLFDFNPLEDLHSITAYGTEFGKEEAVAVIKGRYDPEKVLAMMTFEGSRTESSYGDFTVHKREKGSETFFFCFYSGNTVVFSNKDHLLRLALDVLTGKKESLADGGALRDMQSLPEGTFFCGAAEGFGNMKIEEPQARVLQKAEKIKVAVGELEANNFVLASLTMDSTESATQVHDVLRGLLALGNMFGEHEPDLAGLIRDVQLHQDGRRVALRFTRPSQDLFDMLKKHMKDVK
jgi:hypothetical protein